MIFWILRTEESDALQELSKIFKYVSHFWLPSKFELHRIPYLFFSDQLRILGNL